MREVSPTYLERANNPNMEEGEDGEVETKPKKSLQPINPNQKALKTVKRQWEP